MGTAAAASISIDSESTAAESISIDSKSTTNSDILHHPSAKDLVDAFYLQGAVPARSSTKGCGICHTVSRVAAASTSASLSMNDGLCIIHVVGKEENHIRACVDEAADIS